MSKLLAIGMLVLTTLIGCANGGRRTVEVSFEGSDENLAYVQEAANDWNVACGWTVVHVTRNNPDGARMYPSPLMETSDPRGGLTRCTHNPLASDGSGEELSWIAYEPNTEKLPAILIVIAAHEFGHALHTCSDEHDHLPTGIMQGGLGLWDMLGEDGHLKPGAISQSDCDSALQ